MTSPSLDSPYPPTTTSDTSSPSAPPPPRSIKPTSRLPRTWTEPSAPSATTLTAPPTTPPPPSSSSTPPPPPAPPTITTPTLTRANQVSTIPFVSPEPLNQASFTTADLTIPAGMGTLENLRTTDGGRSWQVDLRAPANLAA